MIGLLSNTFYYVIFLPVAVLSILTMLIMIAVIEILQTIYDKVFDRHLPSCYNWVDKFDDHLRRVGSLRDKRLKK